jgi:hypothetical protein
MDQRQHNTKVLELREAEVRAREKDNKRIEEYLQMQADLEKNVRDTSEVCT